MSELLVKRTLFTRLLIVNLHAKGLEGAKMTVLGFVLLFWVKMDCQNGNLAEQAQGFRSANHRGASQGNKKTPEPEIGCGVFVIVLC